MAIDINPNNKHWILVILEKIKDAILIAWRYIITIIKSFGRFIKRIWKILVGFAVLCILILIIALGVDYYFHDYLPSKHLDEAVADIKNKFKTKKDSAKELYAYDILTTDDWGYENISSSDIDERITELKRKAFDYIETQANAGNPRCQYLLGHIYAQPPHKIGNFREQPIFKDNYIKTDSAKAAYWWNEAASRGYIKAYNNIGVAYAIGFGVQVDKKKAIEWIKKGAEGGDATAQFNYGCYFRDGLMEKTGTHKEVQSTTGYFADYDRVIRKVYDDSRGTNITYYWVEVDDSVELIPKDIEQAKFWWKKAAAQGEENAKNCLQKIYN